MSEQEARICVQQGAAALRAGNLDEAETRFRAALVHSPDLVQALHALGLVLSQKARFDEAIAILARAAHLQPHVAEHHCNLGNVLFAAGRLDEAQQRFRRAVQLKPTLAAAHCNMGACLYRLKRYAAAAEAFGEAARLKPDDAEIATNLGAAMAQLGRYDEAVSHHRRAIALRPQLPDAHANLGVALLLAGKAADAAAAFAASLELRPDHLETLCNLGSACEQAWALEQSLAAFQQALRVNPGHPPAIMGLGSTLGRMGRTVEAIAAWREAIRVRGGYPEAHSNLLMAIHYEPVASPREVFEEHRRWAALYAGSIPARTDHGNDRSPDRPLRIGLVSPDFREHSVAYFIRPLIERLDRGQARITCYSTQPRSDLMTALLRSAADHWVDAAGMDDDALEANVREDGIDILVDLAGHTKAGRLLLFARKPAPVQVTYLGYPDTTGLAAMDYRITDEIADPPGESDERHVEKLIRLGGGFLCFRTADSLEPPAPPPCLKSGAITFGSFNFVAKVSRAALETWARVLLSVNGSRLLLKSAGMEAAAVRRRLLDEFSARGVDPSRVQIIAPVQPHSAHMAQYHRVDIALDTFPYAGTTTTCEALWMGVPVVSLAGQMHCSRTGAAILGRIGLHDLVTRDPDDYVRTAVALAADPARLAALRGRIRGLMQASPLCDGARLAREFMSAMREAWRAWCAPR